MGRLVNDVWNLEHGLAPKVGQEISKYGVCGLWDTCAEVRENCPYKPGEPVWVNFGGDGDPNDPRGSEPDIQLCRIYSVSCTYLRSRLAFGAKFRAQWITKKGAWSKLSIKIYPGMIYRAYFDHDEKPRNLGRTVIIRGQGRE